MKLRKILLAVAGLALMLNASAQKSKRYYVAKPGTLVELMTEAEANEITQLTLQGKLNAVDFRHLRDEFKNLQLLDISNASISMYAGKNGTYPNRFYVYPANCIPAYAFCKQMDDSTFVGKETLTRIILSDKTKNIEDAAFKGCKNLKICQIRKKTAPNLLSEALADSVTAIFVPLGCSDSYRTKKKWETFAFIEGEPLTVNVQIGKMGSLASELLRAGFQPKDVNFLTVEGKMDEADFTLIRDYTWSPTGLIPWFSKTEGNTYATLLHHPFLFKGKQTSAQEVARRISGAVAGECSAFGRWNLVRKNLYSVLKFIV